MAGKFLRHAGAGDLLTPCREVCERCCVWRPGHGCARSQKYVAQQETLYDQGAVKRAMRYVTGQMLNRPLW